MNENNERPSVLNMDILSRFLTAREMDELLGKYHKNKIGIGAKSRFQFLDKPLTKTDVELLRWYFSEDRTPNSVKEKEFELKATTLAPRAASAAVRVLYKNKTLLESLLEKIEVRE